MHGIGGNVIGYHALARHLGTDQPTYALQARGIDGKSRPLTSVEEMARCYIQEIRTVEPTGPYRLAGLSFGGTVAYEMARRLHADGQPVEFVALLDSAARLPDRLGGRGGTYRLRCLKSRAQIHFNAFWQTPPSDWHLLVQKRVKTIRRRRDSKRWQAQLQDAMSGSPSFLLRSGT